MINDLIAVFTLQDFYSDLNDLSFIASNVKHERKFVYLCSRYMQIPYGTVGASLGSYFMETSGSNGKKHDLVEINGKGSIVNTLEVKFHLEFDSIKIAKDIFLAHGTNKKAFSSFSDFAAWWENNNFKTQSGKSPTSLVAPQIQKDLYIEPSVFMWIVHHRPVNHPGRICFRKERELFDKKKFSPQKKGLPSYQGAKVHTANKTFLKITDLFAVHSAWRYRYSVCRIDVESSFTMSVPSYESDYHVYLFTKEDEWCASLVESFNEKNENKKVVSINTDLHEEVGNLWPYE